MAQLSTDCGRFLGILMLFRQASAVYVPTWAALRAQAVAWVPSLPRRICQLYLSSRGIGTLLTPARILPAILWQSGEQNQAPAHSVEHSSAYNFGTASEALIAATGSRQETQSLLKVLCGNQAGGDLPLLI